MRPRKQAWAVGGGVFLGLFLLLFPLLLIGCGSSHGQSDPWGNTPKKRVLTSITPMYCFAKTVAGDDAEVRCLMTTTGPHDFQPSIYDAKLLSSADLFVVNGFGLEEFLDSLVRSAGNGQLVVCKTAESIPEERIIIAPGMTHYHGDKLVTHKAGRDPHVWLGLEEAKCQVEAIREALTKIDPPHADGYRKRAEQFFDELAKLKVEAAELHANGAKPKLVTFHDSFRYFCRSFGIEVAGTIRGLRGEDISPSELSKQAREYREAGVRLISVEPQYPKKVAETLRDEMNCDWKVNLVELDPLETGPAAEGNSYIVREPDYYLKQMRQNLANLKQALKP
jgi:zinc transport system substrate-binding protein